MLGVGMMQEGVKKEGGNEEGVLRIMKRITKN